MPSAGGRVPADPVPQAGRRHFLRQAVLGLPVQHQSRGGSAGAPQAARSLDPHRGQPAALCRAGATLLPGRRLRGGDSRQRPAALPDQRPELRSLQDLRHQGSCAEHRLDRARRWWRSQLSQHVSRMRRISLALLSAALLITLPVAAGAQQGGQQRTPPAAKTPAQPQRPPQLSVIPLSGRYLAARVAEQSHDYDTAADEIDRALAMAPDDPDLIEAAFQLRLYAGRIDQASELAPQVLAKRPTNGFANLVLAVQSIKKGDYRTAELQIGRLREIMLIWLKAGEKDYVAARAALAKLKLGNGERAQAPAVLIEAQID